MHDLLKSILFLSISVVIISCGSSGNDLSSGNTSTGQQKVRTDNSIACEEKTTSTVAGDTGGSYIGPLVGYNSHVKKILDSSCVTCHGPRGQKPELYTYDLLSESGFLIAKAIIASVHTGRMPLGQSLTEEDVATLKGWGALGFPEDTEQRLALQSCSQ